MIELDGSQGEGGGQVLRTSLTLSMVTGQPFTIRNIRARRSKPGLMRQHLVSVQSAAQVCGAEVAGASIGSQTLVFSPGAIKAGDFGFDIGTAGSCTLVLQTLIPALLRAPGPSKVRLSGGTHNPMAPPAHFLQRAYCRALADMGARVDIQLERFGFYPAGGGEVLASIEPAPLRPADWLERGAQRSASVESFSAGIPERVGRAQLDFAANNGWPRGQLHERVLPRDQGPGNAFLVTLEFDRVTEVFSAFGERGSQPETSASDALKEARRYLDSGAALDEYLADQVMLPLALAGGGSFTCESVSMHAQTNASVIERFLPVRFRFEQTDGAHRCTVYL